MSCPGRLEASRKGFVTDVGRSQHDRHEEAGVGGQVFREILLALRKVAWEAQKAGDATDLCTVLSNIRPAIRTCCAKHPEPRGRKCEAIEQEHRSRLQRDAPNTALAA